MTTLWDAVVDIVGAAKRRALTEEEARRLLGFVLENHPEPVTESQSQPPESGALTIHAPAGAGVESNGRKPRRRHFGRGENGWVDPPRARMLNLVALLELESPCDRQTRLDYISQHWGRNFQPLDLEILKGAREPRWRKVCEWGLTYMNKDGLVQSPRRGLWELTPEGKRRAEDVKKQQWGP